MRVIGVQFLNFNRKIYEKRKKTDYGEGDMTPLPPLTH